MTSTSLAATTPVDLLALELVANGASPVGAVAGAQESLLAAPLRQLDQVYRALGRHGDWLGVVLAVAFLPVLLASAAIVAAYL